MDEATPAEVVLRLLDACADAQGGAAQLARQAKHQDLKTFLLECARQYGTAADELSASLNDTAHAPPARLPGGDTAPLTASSDVAALWELAECDALACFRDAFDADLPVPLARTVKRHYEAGISRLERFRALQAQLV